MDRRRAAAWAGLVGLVIVAAGAGSRGTARLRVHLGLRDVALVLVALGTLSLLGFLAAWLGSGEGRAKALPVALLATLALGAGIAGAIMLWSHRSVPPHAPPPAPAQSLPPSIAPRPVSVHGPHATLPLLPLLLGGLLAAVLAAAVITTVVARGKSVPEHSDADEQWRAIYAAVDAGDDAMRDVADPRAAIIACYAAMEFSLARSGVRRRLADTPTELLQRAAAAGIASAAAGQLTELFLTARFSTHPMSEASREQARAALAQLRAAASEMSPASSGARA